MLRRFFISAFSSVMALTTASFDPAAAAEDQSTPAQPPMQSTPEPDPISVDPAVFDRARQTLDAVAQGTFDRSELSVKLDAFTSPDFFKKAVPFVSALGPPQSMFAFEKRILADETSTLFRVRYANETLTWAFSVDDANKIVGLSLRRGPRNIIVGDVYRDVQY